MIIIFLIVLFIGSDILAEERFQAELEPGLEIGVPVCKGYPGAKQSPLYTLCVPSSRVENLTLSRSRGAVILKGRGQIQGPVIVETLPRVMLIGSMIIDKGSLELTVTKEGGFQMKGLDGIFQVQGLVVPLSAVKPLVIDEIELEFTSPEDATLQISASGQKAGVVLRVERKAQNAFVFVPSPPANSIFPDNPFFSVFEGNLEAEGREKLDLKLKDGRKLELDKVGTSE